MCIPNRGDTVGFWDDLIDGKIHSQLYPNLFPFAKEPGISFFKLRNSEQLLTCFRIPMTRQAYNEFLSMQEELAHLQQILPDDNDSCCCIWGLQKYSSSKYYQYQFSSLQLQRSVLWIWKSKCTPKINFFAWLLLNDRLNTRNMLRRRNKFLEEGYNCVLCHNSIEETIEHLFFDCPSASSRWFALGIIWEENASIHEKLYIAKQSFQYPFFMEIFLIGA